MLLNAIHPIISKSSHIRDEKLVDYLEDLQHQIESLTISSKNINDKFKDFVEMMQYVCDKYFPYKKLSRKKVGSTKDHGSPKLSWCQ